jgi:hypothetical protein
MVARRADAAADWRAAGNGEPHARRQGAKGESLRVRVCGSTPDASEKTPTP